jgi:CheY-like chemotaxis protein
MSLTGRGLPRGAERGLRTILDESQRAADLVQQIVDFSRSAMLDRETFDLSGFVEEQASFLRRTLSESIQLSIEGSAAPCPVRADKARLRQALVNLVTNARDAMPHGGELRFRIERLELERGEEPPLPDMEKPSWARLRVADTGTGMTKEVREHLFEPFFTTKEVGEGAGLGLSQVHGIVKQHEGYIDVETAVGEGTTVVIYLPLSEENGKEARPAAQSGVPGGAGETILVVEDAPAVRQAVQSTLESLDYRVLTAANGREALEALRLGPVDLVVTDVVMPEVGGEALLDALQERRSGAKAIAMTGHVVDLDIERLKDAGFARVISKPFSFEEIAVAVKRALDG